MPNKQVRILCLFLMVLLLSGMMTGCSKKNPDENGTTNSTTKPNDTTGSGTTQEETTEYKANIPPSDFKEYEFRVMVNERKRDTWGDVDFIADASNGDVINDAVYERNQKVEDLLNIKIVPVETANILNDMTNSILAGDQSFDIAFPHPHAGTILAQEGHLVELHTVPQLQLSDPWWDANAVKDLSIGNKLYMVTGDISTMPKKSIGVILFNKKMIEDYDLENPYDLMKSKKWTMDKLVEMSNSVSQDLNSDGKFDGNDKYGLLYYCDIISLGLLGGGVNFAAKNTDDIPELTFYSDKTVAIFDKFTKLLYDDHLSYSWSRTGVGNNAVIAMFQNNQGLFNFNEFHAIANMRTMDTDFGILPMPLYDESQERYYHTVNPHVAPMLTIPVTNKDLERTGIILQALGAASKNILTPAYYDVSLKGKGTRDEESVATLDIVFSTLKYDTGYLYNYGEIGGFTLGMVDKYNPNLTSEYEKIRPKAEEALKKTIVGYQKVGK